VHDWVTAMVVIVGICRAGYHPLYHVALLLRMRDFRVAGPFLIGRLSVVEGGAIATPPRPSSQS
jgi:hypothetical protein